jgi:peptidoglycan biosynthesis protein MviN/MurJ (putative lipid II flippase)
MFLRAGALSLALLLASRLLGVLRESAQAAAFGTSGVADVAVLMLALPDWIASVLAAGALAYVLLPAWAGQPAAAVAALQRRLAHALLLGGTVVALVLAAFPVPAARWLAAGVPEPLQPAAALGLVWSALAIPAALLAALWATRLQHERDFVGLYGGNLVVNLVLVGALVVVGWSEPARPVLALGCALLAAMGLRLAWLHWRQPAATAGQAEPAVRAPATPPLPVWAWAVLVSGLPLALPFAARSAASGAGEGALATFNYAWKLVELPLVLAIQLVAALALPAIARALSGGAAVEAPSTEARAAVRQAFALAWTLACAAVAALWLAAPAVSELLFGWGRMPAEALDRVASWGRLGSWGLLPQAITAVALAVLASRRQLWPAVAAYAAALGLLLAAAAAGVQDGGRLMLVLNAGHLLVAVACVAALGREVRGWLPWEAFAWSALALAGVAALEWAAGSRMAGAGLVPGLLAAATAAGAVVGFSHWRSNELRLALRR